MLPFAGEVTVMVAEWANEQAAAAAMAIKYLTLIRCTSELASLRRFLRQLSAKRGAFSSLRFKASAITCLQAQGFRFEPLPSDKCRKRLGEVRDMENQRQATSSHRSHSSVRDSSRYLWDMPACPGIPERLLNLMEWGNPSPAEVEKLLSTDPALSAKALRMVNSDYYGLAGQVESLTQAVLLLGMQQIRNLILSVQGHTRGIPYNAHSSLRALWGHSYSTAVGAQLILQKKNSGPNEVESAYLAGLLHDIGKLFLLGRFPSDYPDLPSESVEANVPLAKLELERFGTTHADVGRRLSQHWRIPASLRASIGLDVEELAEDASPELFAVHIADCLTSDPFELEEAPRAIHPNAYVWLGWDEDELDWLTNECQVRTASASEFFSAIDEVA